MESGAAQSLLMYFVLPLWVMIAFADYLCHRVAHIEETAGVKETYIHLLGIAEIGVPVLAALFLDINALIIALMLVCLVLHDLTTYWDLRYAHSVRDIAPIEQHVHNYLGVIPLLAFLLVIVLHWGQFQALFGFGAEAPRFEIRWKEPPLAWRYVLSMLALIVIADLLPFFEELLRGLRAAANGRRSG
jgi:hypothetical protein